MKTLEKYLRDKSVLNKDLGDSFQNFKEILQKSKIVENKEENVKDVISDLLKAFGYTVSRSEVDLLVMRNSKPVAMFETKRLSNNVEMITDNNFNKKAMHETIYNYLKSRTDLSGVYWFIITDLKEWYIFEKHALINAFGVGEKELMNDIGLTPSLFQGIVGKDTAYGLIEKYLDSHNYVQNKLKDSCIRFSLKNNIIESLTKKHDLIINDNEILPLCWFLHPDILAEEYNINAGNKLNKEFYNELLYIMGLKEDNKDNPPKIVEADIEGSFAHQLSDMNFEDKIELILVWFNRILFLKLFEANLIAFNGKEKSYSFLMKNKIPDFATVNKLFFDVLAKKNPRTFKKFDFVPYLNSSLFEEKEIEINTKHKISDITNAPIQYYQNTVLRDTHGDKYNGETNLLDYLLKFLDAFNYGEYGNISSNLISPTVLGLIFEKINGYKDGSYYTPTTITDYMAKTAIEKAILNRVKNELELQYDNFIEFKNAFVHLKEEERNIIKGITKSITVCDPAVGSGHFLVSALNTLISVWWDFGMFKSSASKFDIAFENGDTRFYRIAGRKKILFVYTKDSDKEYRDFQKEIFQIKKEIIENNLFGVDINPKAVEIARLRLWIELLKNAYYINDEEMETLPNIDINIKEGDSILAPINIEMKGKKGTTISIFTSKLNEYKSLFTQYQNITDKEKREGIKEKIKEIRDLLKYGVTIDYDKFIWSLDFPQILKDDGTFRGFDVIIANPPFIDSESMAKTQKQYRKDLAKIYKMARGNWDIYITFFECGLKLLNSEGLLAFITPDKWLSKPFGNELRKEKIRNLCSVIKAGRDVFESSLVDSIISLFNMIPQEYLDISEFKNGAVLKKLRVDKQILKPPYTLDWLFSNNMQILTKIDSFIHTLEEEGFRCESACATSDAYKLENLVEDLENQSFNGEKYLKVINTGTIGKYLPKWGSREMVYLGKKYLKPVVDKKEFLKKFQQSYSVKALSPKIIIKGLTLLHACVDWSGKIVPGKSTLLICTVDKENLKFLLGFINSNLISFYINEKYQSYSYNKGINFTKDMINKLPFPKISDADKKIIINLVNRILKAKEANPDTDTSDIEKDINQLVYQLYGLTDDEIKIIKE